MITTKNKPVALLGADKIEEFSIRTKDGVVSVDSMAIKIDSNVRVQPSILGILNQEPHVIIGKEAPYPRGTINITGSMHPTNRKVYVSRRPTSLENTWEQLNARIIAQTESNEAGQFSFHLNNSEETQDIVIWSEIPTNFYQVYESDFDAAITYESTTEEILAKGPFSYNVGGGSASTEYTLSGGAPTDARKLYVSKPSVEYADDSLMLMELESTVIDEISTLGGTYSKVYTSLIFEPSVTYYVWCKSYVSPTVTANLSGNGGDVDPVCLAGETLITLYDGSKKQLKDLNIDDILLSGSGEPTKIMAITCGGKSDYHTLYYFEDGIIIDEAHRHRFYNVEHGFWQYLDEWEINNRAKCEDGTTKKLISKEIIWEPCMRYGLWTESRDYYANGLLSGETAANQELFGTMDLQQAVKMLASLTPDKLEKMYEGELGQ